MHLRGQIRRAAAAEGRGAPQLRPGNRAPYPVTRMQGGGALRQGRLRAYRRPRPRRVRMTAGEPGGGMRNLARVLRQHAFHLLLLVVALIVFVKPMVLTTGSEGASTVVLELFLPWA